VGCREVAGSTLRGVCELPAEVRPFGLGFQNHPFARRPKLWRGADNPVGAPEFAHVPTEASSSRLTAGAATAEQFPENVEIRHHTDAMLFAIRPYGGEAKCRVFRVHRTSASPSAAVYRTGSSAGSDRITGLTMISWNLSALTAFRLFAIPTPSWRKTGAPSPNSACDCCFDSSPLISLAKIVALDCSRIASAADVSKLLVDQGSGDPSPGALKEIRSHRVTLGMASRSNSTGARPGTERGPAGSPLLRLIV
jgi:hypothetical protein